MKRMLHLTFIIAAVVLISSACSISAQAGWSHDPAVNTAITTQVGADTDPAITDDGAGGAIIAWAGASYDIYVQRIDGSGNLLWGANGKALTSNGNNYYPKLVSDGSGGAIIVWQVGGDGSGGIYVQKVDGDGDTPWGTGGEIISSLTGNHQYPRITSDGSGGAIIAWQERLEGRTDYDIYAQWVNFDGMELLPAFGFEVCTEAGDQFYPQIISDGDQSGDSRWFIIAWQDGRANWEIYAQKLVKLFDSELEDYTFSLEWESGGAAVTSDADTQHLNPRLVNDGEGGAIISWQDNRSKSSDYRSGVYAQRIGADGVAQWTGNGVNVCDLSGDQINPEMTGDGSGGAVIAWWDFRNGTGYNIYAQRIDAVGAPAWPANGVAVTSSAIIDTDSSSPQIVADGANGAVITWGDRRNGSDLDIYAQRIGGTDGHAVWTADGTPVSTAVSDQLLPVLTGDAGGAIVAWLDLRSGEGDIYSQKILPGGTLPLFAPTVTTEAVSVITATSATLGGNVASEGGSAVTARGICWGPSPDPVVAGGNCLSAGSGSGSFVGTITPLTPNTPYHARAFATNAVGTSYGSNIPFATNSKFGLNLTFAGNGKGTVSGGGTSCGSACTLLFDQNTTAQLQASTLPYYFFTSWSGACSGGSTQCSVLMNSDNKNVTATFTLDAANSVRIKLPTETRYSSIGDAIRLDPDGKAVIDAWGCEFAESPTFDRGVFTLKGGWNQAYTSQSGATTINGTLTVKSGSVTVERLAIR